MNSPICTSVLALPLLYWKLSGPNFRPFANSHWAPLNSSAKSFVFGRKISSAFAGISFSIIFDFFPDCVSKRMKNEEFYFSASRYLRLKDKGDKGAESGPNTVTRSFPFPGARRMVKLPLTNCFVFGAMSQVSHLSQFLVHTAHSFSPFPLAAWSPHQPQPRWQERDSGEAD